MTPNPVKRKLKEGRPAVGMWLAIGDPIVVETLAALGCAQPETVNRRIAEGWRLVGGTSDIYHLSAGARAARAIIKTE